MLNMSQINNIRDLMQCGYNISEIEKITGFDRKTIRKYLQMDDFSPHPQKKQAHTSILDTFKPIIDAWLKEDQKYWYKQRHTAQRVFDRLTQEHGYTGSYDTVRRYVKTIRNQQKSQRANQELIWDPGYAQADFGEADFYEQGTCIRKKYLVLSFPYSNDSYCQVFGGETSECVCQGLQDIFHYIEGVPPVIIFDNATGIGRRMYDQIHESALFSKFRAHHRFKAKFCNPRSGWEKGNVEKKVDYDRHNLFVPVPHYDDIIKYNKQLLSAHEKKAAEIHYKKERRISELFEDDRNALLPLPIKRFNVCRYETLRADGYGKICIEGKHYYSTCPEFSGKKDVLVGIRAHYVEIYDKNGNVMVRHPRAYGDRRTDAVDYSTTIRMLLHRPGAWKNSGVRRELTDPLREYMDNAEKSQLKKALTLLEELNREHGFRPAIKAMDLALREGCISASDARIIAGRITGYGLDTPPAEGPPLSVYDMAFLDKGKGGAVS